MFAASKTATPAVSGPDAKFNYVTMLLHGDGTNGAQNNTFLDSSSNNFTITRNGNTTQGSFSPYGSNWSNYFNGSTGYLSIANNAALNMGTGDFTVEAWVYLSSVAIYNCVISLGKYTSGAGVLRVSDSAKLQWYFNDAGVVFIESTTSVSANTWTHVAAVRSSGTTKLYINGVNSGSSADTSNYTSTFATLVGAENQASPANFLSGYVSNVRVVKGTAVYTSNFTPSTTPLTAISGTSLLTCQSNRFFDASSNAFAITLGGSPSVQRFNPFGASTAYSTTTIGGSGYFDGTGDSLTTPSNAVFGFGTGNFTVELWFYPLSTTAAVLYDPRTANDQSPSIAWGATVSAKFQVITNQVVITSSSTYSVGQWYHIAVTRSSTTVTLWVNGTSQGTTTNSTNLPTTSVIIGDYISSGYSANGYLSDVRITKGGALYTTAFTPPSSPLTTTVSSGTVSLLTNMTNGAIYDNAMMNDLETVGNAQISTSVKKFGTGSLAFDGTGDYLVTPYQPTTQLGSGNFTIEFWIYFNSVASGQEPLSGYKETAFNWGFYITSSGTLSYYLSSNGTTWNIASNVSVGSISTGQWYHVALVRNGSTFTPYLNGVAGTTTTNSSAIYANSDGIYVGGLPGGYSLNGYIDDLRITKGYARYTTTFTPPTAAFPNTGPN